MSTAQRGSRVWALKQPCPECGHRVHLHSEVRGCIVNDCPCMRGETELSEELRGESAQ